MKIFIILFVLVQTSVLSSAELSLEQLKNLALKNSYSLNAAKSNIESSEAQIELQRSKFLPKLGVQVGREWIRADNFSDRDNFRNVYGTINLFNGFKDSNQFKRAKVFKSGQTSLLKNEELNLKLEIELLYYTYLFLKKKQQVTSIALSRNEKHLKLVKKRLNSSLVTKTDLLEFKLRSSQLLSEKDFIELELLRVKKRLLNFSGIQDIKSYKLVGSLPHLHLKGNLDNLVNENLEQNTEVKSLNYRLKGAELSQKISKSGWYPKIDLQARYGRLDENETGVSNNINSSQVTLMATWELFSGFSTTNKSKVASAQKTASEYKLRQKKLDLKLEVEGLLDELKILQKRIDTTEANQKLSNTLYKRTLKEYQKGVKNSGDLVSASDLFRSLSSEISEMKLKYIKSKIDLERALGLNLDFEVIKH